MVAGAGAAFALVPAASAQASIVGIGNAVVDNTCVNHGDTHAVGSAHAGSGVIGGNAAGLPLGLSRNDCGNSGIVCTALFMSSV